MCKGLYGWSENIFGLGYAQPILRRYHKVKIKLVLGNILGQEIPSFHDPYIKGLESTKRKQANEKHATRPEGIMLQMFIPNFLKKFFIMLIMPKIYWLFYSHI